MCKLDIGFEPADCTDLGVGGTSGVMTLINFDDYLTATLTEDPDGTIRNIVLTNIGSQAYKYVTVRGGFAPSSPLSVNDGGKSGFTHTLAGFIPTKDQAVKKAFTNLINFGRVVAIVILDNEVVANVFGNDVGLTMSAFDETPVDPATGGGIQVTLSTPTNTTLENLPPRTYLAADNLRATTIAQIEALTTPVV